MAIGDYLTTEDVAELLHVTPARVRHFVADERLIPEKKIGQVWFFDPEKVRKFAEIPRKTGRPKSEE